jgi:4-amino-4-deoxy-L-arabinose transferase-like glycosyltransferase
MQGEAPQAGRWCKLAALSPVLLAAVIYLATTTSRGVIDYDEGYYSQPPLHMVASGDWVTPYANGVRFLEKPPLMYWLTAASFRIFGVNEFALRLPSALGVIALVWIVTLIARRACGERAGIVAGMCMACSAGTYLFTREALHEVWMVLFLTLALYAFLEWYLDPRHSLRHALLLYTASALGFMTKSLIGIAFPAGIIAAFFLICREWPDWRRIHLLPGTALFLLLTVPWHWLAAMRNPGFLYAFFVNEQILRFLGKHDPPVIWSVPLLAFWGLIFVWFFPWTAFLPAAFVASREPASVERRAVVRLTLAWFGLILAFFSLSARLEHYAFPLIPAMSVLVGIALSGTGESKSVKWAFRALALLGGLVLAAGIAGGLWLAASKHGLGGVVAARTDVVSETDFSILADFPPSIRNSLVKPAVVTIASFAVCFPAALWFEKRRRRMTAVMCVAAAMMMVCVMTHWSLLICEDVISSKKFGIAVAREAQPGDRLVVVGDYESANSLSFYEPLRVEVLNGVAYALIPGMKYRDAPRVLLTRQEFEAAWRSEGRVFALVSRARAGELKPGGARILEVLDRELVRNH